MRTPFVAGVLALGIIAGVTACSQHDHSPAPSPSTTPAARTAECSHGVALLQADGQHNDQPGCDTFQLMGMDNDITVGDTKQLTVEGDHNTVTVKRVENVTSTGEGNTVYYEGDEPDFTELGSDTRVLPISQR